MEFIGTVFPGCPKAFSQLVSLGHLKLLKALNNNIKGPPDSLCGRAWRNCLAVNLKDD